ncbi:adenosylcobinamide-phosphate synthase CbiB [Vogesella mureinivorans]|uniref:adenosylcobinamide-phosphate synthase CbiB n=1 Tax=Vogesella mureinivorans TaxID=657276 RepID=UPI0011C96F75|nr:adenosylcobinamide-phosphate synthase CbiB [Vogesella mureinivorans]
MLGTSLLLAAGLLADRLLGEPTRYHPLVGFGHAANLLEKRLNVGRSRLLRGAFAWALLVLPLPLLLAWLMAQLPTLAATVLSVAVLYFTLGRQSLIDHTRPIADALLQGKLAEARALTARIVSRDLSQADDSAITRAATESLLENGHDAVFGALFWFAVGGAPAALAYRLANTLDAMWGYRNDRFERFGKTAARADDVLGYVPSRLTALAYALAGNTRLALASWRRQAPLWDSPNAGPVMAAGAGALGVQLGGAAVYHGQLEARPALGAGPAPRAGDIRRAAQLMDRAIVLWLLLALPL